MTGMNPVIHADFPDPDVVRVGDAYYMISTTMHMFPGAQILRSFDLMHWEHCGYVYDALGETARQRMAGDPDEGPVHIYGKGMWAASLKHDGQLFHAVFTSNDTGHSYHFTAEEAAGPWTRRPMAGFWYDPGLLFDDDGRVYVAHGNRTVRITELTADLSEKRDGGLDRVLVTDDNPRLGWEGSHLLRHDGWYYLFCIHWQPDHMRAMGCFRARSLDGVFEGGEFMELDLDERQAGVAQGGPVQLHDGSWALFLFQDHGAVGRIPVVVPFRWVDGWPVVTEVPKQLELPSSRPDYEYAPLYTGDDLRGGWSVLWQWNHEPSLDLVDSDEDGLHITADRLAGDCTQAVNTLTQRCFGPRCTAEVTVDGGGLNIGDYAGLCALQGCFAQLALTRTREGFSLSLMTREDAHAPYAIAPAAEPVCELARLETPDSRVRLRAAFDFVADTVQMAVQTGDGWRNVGQPHQLVYRLDHFMGCRVGLFMYATEKPGGSACFSDFACHVKEE
ncbi:MAG: family 43 glycosylhydrolase [Clostridia bacterium]|nr:family 43 glycosylhydrolase [Clostridia bacterium]